MLFCSDKGGSAGNAAVLVVMGAWFASRNLAYNLNAGRQDSKRGLRIGFSLRKILFAVCQFNLYGLFD